MKALKGDLKAWGQKASGAAVVRLLLTEYEKAVAFKELYRQALEYIKNLEHGVVQAQRLGHVPTHMPAGNISAYRELSYPQKALKPLVAPRPTVVEKKDYPSSYEDQAYSHVEDF